jgi:ferredoxin
LVWIDLDLCISCGICASVCPSRALSIGIIEEQKELNPSVLKERKVSIDQDKCSDCSECVKECPSQAISFEEYENCCGNHI